jgi:hypothetical protein
MAIALLVCNASAFVVTPHPGTNYIRWNWTDDDTAIWKIVLDGGVTTITNQTYPTDSQEYIYSGLDPLTAHSIAIFDDVGDTVASYNSTTTLPSTAGQEGFNNFLITWGYLILIAILCVVGMMRKLGIFLIVAAAVSLYAIYALIQANTISSSNPYTEIPFLIYLVFFVVPIYLALVVKGGVFK